MSLTQGDPLPNITTTKETATQGPDWYNTYLEDLAKPGTGLMQKTGTELVAPMDLLQTGAITAAPTDLTRYEDMLTNAGSTAELAAKGITPEMIQQYLNPYTSGFTTTGGVKVPGVVDEMERLSQQNLQRNLLPSLKGAFVGTGGTGSQRMMGALGQMGADVQANLTGAQTKALETAYNKAIDTAGTQSGLYRQAAETERGVAQTDLEAAIKSLEEQYGLGSKQQQFEQSKILAPVAAAKSAADVYANVKVPSTVSETANAPIPGAYSTSPLAQIAGLGSLFASGAGGTSAASGVGSSLANVGKYISGLLTPTGGTTSYAGVNAEGTNVYYNSSTGNYTDSSGNVVPIAGGEGE